MFAENNHAGLLNLVEKLPIRTFTPSNSFDIRGFQEGKKSYTGKSRGSKTFEKVMHRNLRSVI